MHETFGPKFGLSKGTNDTRVNSLLVAHRDWLNCANRFIERTDDRGCILTHSPRSDVGVLRRHAVSLLLGRATTAAPL